MKIAILGSAPSSLGLAPIGDPSFKIWGCSPGVYSAARRCDAWFELHRWEPGRIGIAESQKQWFSPEYVAWMAQRDPRECPVWMFEPVPEIPASRALPIDDLVGKYGSYFFTSSISIMIACAIEDILEAREKIKAAATTALAGGAKNFAAPPPDEIALFGVDMSATEEYGYQRAGCQHFLLIAADLGIRVTVPPESDLLRPMPIYGIVEHSHWHIKNTARMRELTQRLAAAEATELNARNTAHFLRGAIDDLKYQMETWGEDRTGQGVHPTLLAQMPSVRAAVIATQPAPPPTPLPAQAVEGLRLLEIVSSRSEKGEDPVVTLQRILIENEARAFTRKGAMRSASQKVKRKR